MKIKSIKLEKLPLGKGARLLGSNEDGLLAFEKPAGLMTHPNSKKDEKRALLNARYDLREECYHWEDTTGVRQQVDLVHRLDSATSGVILASLNRELTKIIKEAFLNQKITKIYYAIVKGTPKGIKGIWDDRLMKDCKNGNRIIKNAISVRAKSHYQMIKRVKGGFPISLVKLMPITGRTHQLRIQCRKRNIPIVGDQTYGSFSFNRGVRKEVGLQRMLLHSSEVSFSYFYKGTKKNVKFASELPVEFQGLLEFRPGMDMEALHEHIIKTQKSQD
ncbi:MAG: tRNA pseudouridine synthase C [Opitutia bacterium UBA7350]|nr:MAG: tRNA pseudouridine synthase C [Opitutae bacterium UBA7350]